MEIAALVLSAGSFIGIIAVLGILGKIAQAFMQMSNMFGGGKRK